MNSTPDIGLVLCGGGGRGAYQIGVWQALNELGLDRYINGVSGTSAGALNTALFAYRRGSGQNIRYLVRRICAHVEVFRMSGYAVVAAGKAGHSAAGNAVVHAVFLYLADKSLW